MVRAEDRYRNSNVTLLQPSGHVLDNFMEHMFKFCRRYGYLMFVYYVQDVEPVAYGDQQGVCR